MRRAALLAALCLAPLAARAGDEDDDEPRFAPPAARRRSVAVRRSAEEDERLARRIRAAASRAAKAVSGYRGKEARTLVALTLLRAGGAGERIAARTLIESWWQDAKANRLGHSASYELSLAISALEGISLELVDEPHPALLTRYERKPASPDVQRMLETATKALLDGRASTQAGKGCAWGYGVAPFNATTRGKREETFDNSNTQFALLALHDAARGGCEVPREILSQIATHFLAGATHTRPVRWEYASGCGGGTPSMTCGGLSSLAAVRELGLRDARVDEAIAGGLEGASELVSGWDQCWQSEKKSGWGPAYNLYSLEKALDLLDVKTVDGEDWFAPIAETVLARQADDGLFGKDTVDTCLYVLFLMRGTVSRSRIVDGRTSSRGAARASPGEVWLPRSRETEDAVALVGSFAVTKDTAAAVKARARAQEAIDALLAEDHGREACLLPTLVALAEKGTKRDIATGWLRDVVGRDLLAEEAKLAALWAASLVEARERGDAGPPRDALATGKLALPLRAFAASSLAQLPCPAAAPEIVVAAERLAEEQGATLSAAGSRCARAYAFALAALVRAPIPALPAKPVPGARSAPRDGGAVSAEDLRGVARAARQGIAVALAASVDRCLAAFSVRGKEALAWTKARAEMVALGRPGLRRLSEVAGEARRAALACELLRELTGETIPDDAVAWGAWVDAGEAR